MSIKLNENINRRGFIDRQRKEICFRKERKEKLNKRMCTG